MSRIGKNPVVIPEGVEVQVSGQNVKAKGKLGELNLSELRACLATGYKQRQLGTLLSVVETLQQELAS